MSAVREGKEPHSLSPGLLADDALAIYWLRQVTLRLRREICWCWYERGLLSDSNSGNLPPFVDRAVESLNMTRYREEKKRFFQTDPTAQYLTGQLRADIPLADGHSPRGSFSWVIKELDLDGTATFILSLGLAVAFDNAIGSVIAACLNDPAKTYPNLSLAQKLWDDPERVLRLADPVHPLFCYGLLQHMAPTPPHYSVMDWESPITAPISIASQLLFPDAPLPQALMPVTIGDDENVILNDVLHLVAAKMNHKNGDRLRVGPLHGRRGSAPIEIVRGIAKIADKKVVEFRGDSGLLKDADYLKALATCCWLRGAALYLNQTVVSRLCRDSQHSDLHLHALKSIPITLLLGITEKGQLANVPQDLMQSMVDVPLFSYPERMSHWKKVLGKEAEGLDRAISECSRRFRYEKETIQAISEGLKGLPNPISEEAFVAACRAELVLDIDELAQKVIPRFNDEELILPHKQHLQFEEIVRAMKSLTEVHYGWGTARVWNESGIAVLFAGPPGSGKTMAAEILALQLDLPMYRIDLSQVVNKYIGETEKNLKRLFDTADASDLILFFDEADSLFGRRTEVKDAHDRYANLEISDLLERMERFKGLAILATNRKKDLDEAFLRRLRFIIDFPLPEAGERKRIWRQVVPGTVDHSRIDFDFLARQFPLTGGHIRSIVFNACLQSAHFSNPCPSPFKAQLTMEQIIIAVKREYDKLNRSVSLEQFGSYAKIVKEMEHKDERHQN